MIFPEASAARSSAATPCFYYPSNGVVTYNIGRMQAAHGHLDEALKSMEHAIELTPAFTLSYFAAATIQDHLGHRAEAIASVNRGLAIDLDDERLRDLQKELAE